MMAEGVGRELTPIKFGITPGRELDSSPVTKPDKFGQVYNAEKDVSSGNVPSAEESNRAHFNSDADSSPRSLHHTLGHRRNQASPGDHIHDGTTSKRIVQVGTVSISFTALTSFTQVVTFPQPYGSGVVPVIMTNINTGGGETARWESRAISITNTGFTLFLFRGDTADAAQTWTNVPVQWMSTI